MATTDVVTTRAREGDTPLQTPHPAEPEGPAPDPGRGGFLPCTPPKVPPMWIKIRTNPEEKRQWQSLAKNRGVSLSELVRSLLSGQRLRKRRVAPSVDPVLLRDLARIGNNLNQLAHAANRYQPVPATALLVRLIEIDRELSAIRQAHERPAGAD